MVVAGGEREQQEGGVCVAGIKLGWVALGDFLQIDDAQGQADVCSRSVRSATLRTDQSHFV